ncbi:MAG: chemotaxis protein CheW [Deltaproteobacteria bacterium]|nr:chemotaxis protein CheW [Deltaproteobacteria bacterium]
MPEKNSDSQTILTFRVGNYFLGLPAMEIEAIVPIPKIHYIPRAPYEIPGFCSIHGKTATVVSLPRKFGLPDNEVSGHGQLLLCRLGSEMIAFQVDEVLDISPENDWATSDLLELRPSSGAKTMIFRDNLIMWRTTCQQLFDMKCQPSRPPVTDHSGIKAECFNEELPASSGLQTNTELSGRDIPTNVPKIKATNPGQATGPGILPSRQLPSPPVTPPAKTFSARPAHKVAFRQSPPLSATHIKEKPRLRFQTLPEVTSPASKAATEIKAPTDSRQSNKDSGRKHSLWMNMGAAIIVLALCAGIGWLWREPTGNIKTTPSSPAPQMAVLKSDNLPMLISDGKESDQSGGEKITADNIDKKSTRAVFSQPSANIEGTTPATIARKVSPGINHALENSSSTILLKIETDDFTFLLERPEKEASSPARPPSKKTAGAGALEIVHTVIRGDTLWHIAKHYLDNPLRYPELARLSRIENPHLIFPGDRVRIIRKIRQ